MVAATVICDASARAADCGDSAAGFNEWLTSFKQVAINNGISQQVVDSALSGVTFDPSVAAHDRGQNFGSNFAAFSARHVTPARIKKGKMMMLAYAEPLERIEQRYGVPGPVVVAIWGLQTDFGAGLGGYSMFSALATLAYYCSKTPIHHSYLIDTLFLV
jgi:membrane-bound lytic murein transglycosylase B